MNRLIKNSITTLIGLIAIAFITSCGGISEAAYRNAINDYLNNKYEGDFSVNRLTMMFDGNSGRYAQALCSSDRYGDDEFSVYCYLDASLTDDVITVSGTRCSIEDKYAGILYQNTIRERLGIEKSDDYVVLCKVDFYGKEPTEDDMKQGMEYCLKKTELGAYIKVYIISDDLDVGEEFVERSRAIIEKYQPSCGYIYNCSSEDFSSSLFKSLYEEYKEDFGNYLTGCSWVEKLDFYCYHSDEGWAETKDVKKKLLIGL